MNFTSKLVVDEEFSEVVLKKTGTLYKNSSNFNQRLGASERI